MATEQRAQADDSSSDSFEMHRRSLIQKKLKFVVRRIPLFVSEDEIKSHLQQFEDQYDWFYMCGQPRVPNPTRRNKQNFNRFYIHFKQFDDAIPFIEKFKKLEFVKQDDVDDDEKDDAKQKDKDKFKERARYRVMVEFSPNQQLPGRITTKDRRTNTIESDVDYLAFVAGLKTKQERCEQIKKETEQTIIRRAADRVIDTYGTSKLSQKSSTAAAADKDKDKGSQSVDDASKQEAIIAPLAKHVATFATKTSSRKLTKKKIDRASLVKSEKLKERQIDRVREMRRRKRLTLARMNKQKEKYGKHWIAKSSQDAEAYAAGRGGGRGRGRGRGRGSHGVGHGDDDAAYHDPEDNASRKTYKSKRSIERKKQRERERDRERAWARDGDGDEHFSGYSRKRGHQTWQKAK